MKLAREWLRLVERGNSGTTAGSASKDTGEAKTAKTGNSAPPPSNASPDTPPSPLCHVGDPAEPAAKRGAVHDRRAHGVQALAVPMTCGPSATAASSFTSTATTTATGCCGEERAPKWGRRRVLKRPDRSAFRTVNLRTVLNRVSSYAGVPQYGPHALRHSFGTRLMLNGASASVAMELLGHSSLSTTQPPRGSPPTPASAPDLHMVPLRA